MNSLCSTGLVLTMAWHAKEDEVVNRQIDKDDATIAYLRVA